jgi:hypothetical protein
MKELDELRSRGWTVAVHNDYWHGIGVGRMRMTFWLLTCPKLGLFAKGEAETDVEAVSRAVSEAVTAEAAWRRAHDAFNLAKRVIAELTLPKRFPCPECGRVNGMALRLIRSQPVEADRETPLAPVHWTGCWRCNEGDRLLALAEAVLR